MLDEIAAFHMNNGKKHILPNPGIASGFILEQPATTNFQIIAVEPVAASRPASTFPVTETVQKVC